MEHEFETPPASPAIKAAAGIIVVLVIVVVAQVAGFVDLGFGGNENGVEVGDDTDSPVTSEVPETLAFDEEDTNSTGRTRVIGSEGGDGEASSEAEDGTGRSVTQPTIVQEIELNPDVTSTTTSTPTSNSTSTTEVSESSTTTDPESTTTTEAPELDENGDPIEDDPEDNYQPVIRNYGDNEGGSS